MKVRFGFTLIELLVVIAIIVILAAILFPVFAKVREKARQTSCLSNTKQLALGFAQYVNDFDETSPCGNSYYTVGAAGWAGQMYPYVKDKGVFKCPDDSTTSPAPDQDVVSYGYNGNFSTLPRGDGNPPAGVSIAAFASPANTIALFEVAGSRGFHVDGPYDETNYVNGGSSPAGYGVGLPYELHGAGQDTGGGPGTFTLKYATGYFSGLPTANQADFNTADGRHTGGSNYGFADGHSRWLKAAAVSPGTTNMTGTPGDCGTTTWVYNKVAASTDCTQYRATWSLK